MSIRNRLNRLERDNGGDKATALNWRTIFLDENGEPDGELDWTIIIWGYGQVRNVGREENETREEFMERVERLKRMTWLEAEQSDLRFSEQERQEQ